MWSIVVWMFDLVLPHGDCGSGNSSEVFSWETAVNRYTRFMEAFGEYFTMGSQVCHEFAIFNTRLDIYVMKSSA
jgi:hypothetical protein